MSAKNDDEKDQSVDARRNDHILAIQVGTGEPEIHRDISEDQVLRTVTEKAPALANVIQETTARLSAIRSEVLADPDSVVDYYLLQAAQAKVDESLNLDLEDLSEADQFRSIEALHRYSSIGSALLYDGKNFSGRSKFFTKTWPNMKWWPYRFNDKASSAKVWGFNVLFQHTWYRGRRLYLVGIPFAQFPDLADFDFDNRTSSFVSLG
jgi:hypothetical protein